ncbi:MAG TPA: DUF805 domain-containing protein [Ideonella sp.]|jgi:uncharacterized membrane protein YhaH (DUF805 family)|nr:DUF805 domain-containing protein [Ideonella sp.]
MSMLDARLGRRGFWIGSLLLWAAFFGLRPLLATLPVAALGWSAVAVVALLLLMRARLRDRGRSPWALLALALPVLGALWLFWELACRGTPVRLR